MSVSRTERPSAPNAEQGSEIPLPKPTWQGWLEGFQGMCLDHNVDPAALTADKRPFFTIITADYLHRDTVDTYSQIRAAETEQATGRPIVPLPHRLTHTRLQEYYRRFPARPVDSPEDRVRDSDRHDFQQTQRRLAYEASGRFREIRIAQLLRSQFASNGQPEAAESMRELLTAYGMVVAALRTYAYNAINPPHVMETTYAAEGTPPLGGAGPNLADIPPDESETSG